LARLEQELKDANQEVERVRTDLPKQVPERLRTRVTLANYRKQVLGAATSRQSEIGREIQVMNSSMSSPRGGKRCAQTRFVADRGPGACAECGITPGPMVEGAVEVFESPEAVGLSSEGLEPGCSQVLRECPRCHCTLEHGHDFELPG
jgi:hypothetical protein